MKHVNHLSTITMGVILYWFTAGCQSIPVTPLPKGADPTAEINKSQSEEQAAIEQQVDALSPTNFQKAQKSLQLAQKSRDAGDKPEATLKYIEESRAYLDKAMQNAAIARTSLSNAVQRRAEAIKVDASKYAKKAFEAVDEDFKKATKKIEDNDTSLAEKEHDSLAGRFQQVKVEALKESELGEAGKEITQAKKEGAKQFVPATLDETINIYKEANAAIDKTPDDRTAWQASTEAARTASARLLNFTREGKALGGRDPEAVLLQKEANAKKIASSAAALNALQQQNTEKQTAISQLEQEKEKLSSAQQVHERIKQVQHMFKPQEAEVFSQGDKLVVRLKGMDFVKGSANISTQNYALLNKVGQVMQSFGKSSVIIEGHTDSMGSAAANKHLSEQRARAVAQYLSANSGIPADSIETIGYGYEKPIATNKTAEGRAQNRRVDVIIEPLKENPKIAKPATTPTQINQ